MDFITYFRSGLIDFQDKNRNMEWHLLASFVFLSDQLPITKFISKTNEINQLGEINFVANLNFVNLF